LPASWSGPPAGVATPKVGTIEDGTLVFRALEARSSEILERLVRYASFAGPIGPVGVVALIGVGHGGDRPPGSVAGQ
jgi:hypothetical protein